MVATSYRTLYKFTRFCYQVFSRLSQSGAFLHHCTLLTLWIEIIVIGAALPCGNGTVFESLRDAERSKSPLQSVCRRQKISLFRYLQGYRKCNTENRKTTCCPCSRRAEHQFQFGECSDHKRPSWSCWQLQRTIGTAVSNIFITTTLKMATSMVSFW